MGCRAVARGRCLPPGVLPPGRPGAGRQLDLPARGRFAAPVAAEVWAEVASAAGVEGESGWAARGRVVAIAPFHEHDEGGPQLTALIGEQVLRTARSLRVRNAFEQLLVAQPLEPVCEDVGSYPEVGLEVLEPREADDGVAQDEQRPALPDDFQ